MSDESYFRWLYSLVSSKDGDDPTVTHSILLSTLHSYDFAPIVPNDENRVYDALALRIEYASATGDQSVLRIDDACSVLEMIMALTQRIDFETQNTSVGYEYVEWFWILLGNLGLREITDEVYMNDPPYYTRHVGRVIGTLNSRSYSANGEGGLFPLHHTNHDQRTVEIWSQMQAYLLENGDFG